MTALYASVFRAEAVSLVACPKQRFFCPHLPCGRPVRLLLALHRFWLLGRGKKLADVCRGLAKARRQTQIEKGRGKGARHGKLPGQRIYVRSCLRNEDKQ